ncbi:hypothetical protein NIIDNTM18_41050 [Mycolicibacterium litorale]|uniref:Uncharacterized protein n=1 Tax=Mycolicibacterium litorale TaxID=758802 RepID=A0A6S6PB35_9MYCO|nr:hypothetical protein NIIDNTM18_41050 [Mycolicibacterium litorale]
MRQYAGIEYAGLPVLVCLLHPVNLASSHGQDNKHSPAERASNKNELQDAPLGRGAGRRVASTKVVYESDLISGTGVSQPSD